MLKFRVFKVLSQWEILIDAPTAKDSHTVATVNDKQHADILAAAPELLEAVKLFQQFFDEMPKGQFGKITCDIGLMNDAFIAAGRAVKKAEAK